MNIGVCIVIHMHMAFYSMYVLLGALVLKEYIRRKALNLRRLSSAKERK